MQEFGVLSLIPAAVVISLAIFTRRPIESLVAGSVAGLLMLYPTDLVTKFSELVQKTILDETIGWIILVCGFMGSLIVLLLRSGAALAFSIIVSSRAKNRRVALLSTWFLGLVIFIDDYLNALAVGTSMRKITDKYKVSREMLSYVVDSTAAPICILLPVSTWAIFFVGVLESNSIVEKGQGMSLYIESIPYMFYAWAAVIIVPLVAAGIFPVIGPMKKAERRAAEGLAEYQQKIADKAEPELIEQSAKVNVWSFLIPMLSLLGISWFYDINVLIGVICAVAITVLMFGVQGVMKWAELFDAVFDGIRLMVPALAVVFTSFMLKDVSEQLGLSAFVIESVKPLMTASMLPIVAFIAIALVAFSTAAFWGVLAISVPIILPLAIEVGTPIPVVVGAMMSAAAFGSHACFYSDSTVLAAQASEVGVMEHALTQLPYVFISAAIAIIGWLIWAI
ncbi:Na+/H+ antiporter NhaC family protein [Aliikangiella coralliicola]|uniref:Sodium:proton antiporter n=1 Tax=Aliikangiella coralliicola TaxID=2592383 RepID=A0A545UD70_9GAMM|nr:Na+/H+ antiporter NhaC family protein [Aliikangiella coralliicola]TQV87409.1 sodium:proton antiporter [Aliikangiella coralliicola]